MVIVRGGVGVDNIDVVAAEADGNPRAQHAGSIVGLVAELALALMFALARQNPARRCSMKSGAWTRRRSRRDGAGRKTLGILGVGRIGRSLARKALRDRHWSSSVPTLRSGRREAWKD
jgi:D-3-phosphoglycerate dehydrogenase